MIVLRYLIPKTVVGFQYVTWLAFFLLMFLAIGPYQAVAAASPAAAPVAGRVKTLAGEVQVEREQKILSLAVGDALFKGDVIKTGAQGRVGITLADQTLLSAGPKAVIKLDDFAFDTTTHRGRLEATVTRGTLSVISGKLAKTSPEAVRFKTPAATLGVRGTSFVIEVGEDGQTTATARGGVKEVDAAAISPVETEQP